VASPAASWAAISASRWASLALVALVDCDAASMWRDRVGSPVAPGIRDPEIGIGTASQTSELRS
jgi:hypothetical protein